jgi:LAS superfamily LD-carboxypeptidase LdcB
MNCKNYIFSFLLLTLINSYAQCDYSKLALTGSGDLELVGTKVKLHSEAQAAFLKMKKAALKEGVYIKILSGYRSFSTQKNIWNRKYKKYIAAGIPPKKALDKIIEYSTLPGTSRHHWGTEIDIIDYSVKAPEDYLEEKNFTKGGCYEKLKKWMDKNSEKFGFYLTYTNNIHRKGFKYEPWHYSYKPISYSCFNLFLKSNLISMVNTLDIQGKQYLTNEFIMKYYREQIQDINPQLK